MIDKESLETFKKTTGFNLWQLEKDYLQHLFLLFLSRHTNDELIFKGGTALQKAYGLNRFSIDLDFTLNDKNLDADTVMEKIRDDISNFGYETELKKIRTKGKTILLKIKGPLFQDNPRSVSILRIEISTRENVLLKPETNEIVPIYTDLQPYTLIIMQLKEILSEKVRAIVSRDKARDVYDLWFLLKRGIKTDFDLVGKKLEYYGMQYRKDELVRSIKGKRGIWEKELNDLSTTFPNFDETSEFIISRLK